MIEPNVILAPRCVYEDIIAGKARPDTLFFAATVLEDPRVTPKQLEEAFGATLDDVLYLFEFSEEEQPTPDVEPEVGADSAPAPADVAAPTFAEDAEAIFSKTIGRPSGIRPHQFRELEQKVGGDMIVVQNLADRVAIIEKRDNTTIQNVDRFIFGALNKQGIEKYRGKPHAGTQRVGDQVKDILAAIPDPPDFNTGPKFPPGYEEGGGD